ncbi:WD40 repeat domain-containing protein [Kamptonema formosum]|uniref:WD40 repeat domain-containing protein n=1 Tax=Kamptonema formosum TaxID=331992 RepID=UPI0008FC1162|nr:hypothetical protein [Oscillatoria sp. PCC 10802]
MPKKRYQSATEARQALPLHRQQKNQTNVYQKTEVAPVPTEISPPSNPSYQSAKSGTNRPEGRQAKGFRCICTLTSHAASVGSIAISSDSQTLVSGSDDRTIKLWQLSRGNLIRTFTQQSRFFQRESTWVRSVAISPQSHAVSAMLDTNADRVIDAVVELNPSDGTVVYTGIDMDQNGTIDVSYSGDGTIHMADLNGDGISSYEEVSFASAAVDALADV